jgi:hypothetical protein
MTDNASLNYSMTLEPQSTVEATGNERPALRHHISCIAHVILLAMGASMPGPSVNGHTISSEAHERDQQFEKNASTDI